MQLGGVAVRWGRSSQAEVTVSPGSGPSARGRVLGTCPGQRGPAQGGAGEAGACVRGSKRGLQGFGAEAAACWGSRGGTGGYSRGGWGPAEVAPSVRAAGFWPPLAALHCRPLHPPSRPPLLHGSPGHWGPDEPSLSPRSLWSPSWLPCPGCPLWWLPGTPPVATCVAVLHPPGPAPTSGPCVLQPGPGNGALLTRGPPRVQQPPAPKGHPRGPRLSVGDPTNVEQRFFPSLRLLRSRPPVSQHRSPGVVLMGDHRETFRVAACQPASLPAALPSPSGPLPAAGSDSITLLPRGPRLPDRPPCRPRPSSTRPRSACRVPSRPRP